MPVSRRYGAELIACQYEVGKDVPAYRIRMEEV